MNDLKLDRGKHSAALHDLAHLTVLQVVFEQRWTQELALRGPSKDSSPSLEDYLVTFRVLRLKIIGRFVLSVVLRNDFMRELFVIA